MSRPFEPDFVDNMYLRSYLSLYQGLGKLGYDWAPDVTLGCVHYLLQKHKRKKTYKNGCYLFLHLYHCIKIVTLLNGF